MTESLFIATCRGRPGERPPVWFMRQAGRFLPEYRAIREKHSMLDVIRTPELAAEVTLQPVRRFPLDAAIIFADILNPLIGMGIELDFVKGEGPKIFNPVTCLKDVERLTVPAPEDNVGYTLEALSLVRKELNNSETALIGFSGAPFTLSCYLVDGEGSKNFQKTRALMLSDMEAFHALQEKLTDLVSDYLVAQANAGAEALQLFDSWLGILGPAEHRLFVAPYIDRIVQRVKASVDVPVIYFAPGAAALFPHFLSHGADILGVDWRMTLTDASRATQNQIVLQGNLDPLVLAFAPPEYLDAAVDRIIDEGRSLKGHIFNVGHGLIPQTPIQQVARVVERIRES